MIYDENSQPQLLPESAWVRQQMLDSFPLPVFVRDADGTLLVANPAFCSLICCGNHQDVRGKKIADFLPAEQAAHFERHDEEVLADRGAHSYEARLRTGSGALREFVLQKSVLLDDQKQVLGVICCMIDETEKRATERRMNEALEQSVIALAMLHKIRAGIIIVDSQLRVINANPGFAKLIGGDLEELYENIPGLTGADLKELVPHPVYRMFASLMSTGEPMLERDLRYQNKLLHVSVVTIYKNRVVGALIRDMSAPSLVREEIVSRAQRVNKQNLETVQKIAFLLGENASVMEELLHSIIESYSYGEEDEA